MKKLIICLVLINLIGCTTKEKYKISRSSDYVTKIVCTIGLFPVTIEINRDGFIKYANEYFGNRISYDSLSYDSYYAHSINSNKALAFMSRYEIIREGCMNQEFVDEIHTETVYVYLSITYSNEQEDYRVLADYNEDCIAFIEEIFTLPLEEYLEDTTILKKDFQLVQEVYSPETKKSLIFPKIEY